MSDPLLGINSPNRLLREDWKTPKDLAEELYAMFTAKGPREVRDTLTIRVPEGKPAIRVVREEGDTNITEGHSFGVTKASPTGPGNAFPRPRRERAEAESRRREASRSEPGDRRRRQDEPGRSEPALAAHAFRPDIEFDASAGFTKPVAFERAFFAEPPMVLDKKTGRYEPLKADEYQGLQPSLGAGGGDAQVYGATALRGQVGSEVQCLLYSKGFDGPPDIDPATNQPKVVTVRIPYIADDEEIPYNFVFFPVVKFGGEYVSQPAVWGY